MKLSRTGMEHEWTKDCNEAFKELNHRLTTTPVLTVPETQITLKFTMMPPAEGLAVY